MVPSFNLTSYIMLHAAFWVKWPKTDWFMQTCIASSLVRFSIFKYPGSRIVFDACLSKKDLSSRKWSQIYLSSFWNALERGYISFNWTLFANCFDYQLLPIYSNSIILVILSYKLRFHCSYNFCSFLLYTIHLCKGVLTKLSSMLTAYITILFVFSCVLAQLYLFSWCQSNQIIIIFNFLNKGSR